MKKFAAFDVDGTIFRSSLLITLVDSLIEEGIFDQAVQQEYETQLKKWMSREGHYNDYINAVIKTFIRHIRGIPYKDFMDVAEKMVEKESKKVYRYTRDLINELLTQNYYLLAISHSPKSVVEKFTKKMGFNKSYGIIYEIGPQGLFTGRLTDEHIILNKANVLRRALRKESLSVKDSIAVGDSESDIPMLELVENPICFNPSSTLYRHARINRWKVIVERKDVIYHIQ